MWLSGYPFFNFFSAHLVACFKLFFHPGFWKWFHCVEDTVSYLSTHREGRQGFFLGCYGGRRGGRKKRQKISVVFIKMRQWVKRAPPWSGEVGGWTLNGPEGHSTGWARCSGCAVGGRSGAVLGGESPGHFCGNFGQMTRHGVM